MLDISIILQICWQSFLSSMILPIPINEYIAASYLIQQKQYQWFIIAIIVLFKMIGLFINFRIAAYFNTYIKNKKTKNGDTMILIVERTSIIIGTIGGIWSSIGISFSLILGFIGIKNYTFWLGIAMGIIIDMLILYILPWL